MESIKGIDAVETSSARSNVILGCLHFRVESWEPAEAQRVEMECVHTLPLPMEMPPERVTEGVWEEGDHSR